MSAFFICVGVRGSVRIRKIMNGSVGATRESPNRKGRLSSLPNTRIEIYFMNNTY